jgi:hypothetical protein
VLAEVTAREIGRVTIAEALELTALRADGTGCAETAHCYGRFAAQGEGITAARIAREAGLPRQRVHEIVKPLRRVGIPAGVPTAPFAASSPVDSAELGAPTC